MSMLPPHTFATACSAAALSLGLAVPATASAYDYDVAEEIVVTDTARKKTSTEMDRSTIESVQASTLSDLLVGIPGLNVGGTVAVNQRLYVRGLDDTDLAITLDGVRQIGNLFHHAGNLALDPALLKRVEVEAGVSSVIGNSGALGGAVRFETVDAADMLETGEQIGARVSAGYSSNDSEKRLNAMVYGRVGDDLDLLGFVGLRDVGNGTDGRGIDVLGRDSSVDDYLLKAEWQAADDHRFAASVERLTSEGDFATRPDFPATDADGFNPVIPTKQVRETGRVSYDFNPASSLVNLSAVAYSTKTRLERQSSSGTTRVSSAVDGLAVTNISTLETGMAEHQITSGMEAYRQTSRNDSDTAAIAGRQVADTLSFYMEDNISFGSHLRLVPGVRYDIYSRDLTGHDRQTYRKLVPAMAAYVSPLQGFTLFGSVSRLFKGPELLESTFGTGTSSVPNPDLKPETGDNWTVGASFEAENALTDGDSFYVTAQYFDTGIKDKIETERLTCADDPATRCYRQVNISWANIHGVEVSANYALAGGTSLALSYSRSRSEVPVVSGGALVIDPETGLPFTEPLDRDRGDTVTARLTVPVKSAGVTLSWLSTFVANRYFAYDDNLKAGYDVHSISAVWTPEDFLKGASITLGIDNIFDAAYYSHSSRVVTTEGRTDYQLGRNAKLTVSYQF